MANSHNRRSRRTCKRVSSAHCPWCAGNCTHNARLRLQAAEVAVDSITLEELIQLQADIELEQAARTLVRLGLTDDIAEARRAVREA